MPRLFHHLLLVSGLLATASVSHAQPLPQGAHVNLYFPHLADGGPPQQQWQMRLTFTNPNLSAVQATIQFFRDDGGPLTLNFGSGPVSQFSFAVPPQGSRIFRSTAASSSTVTGWALAFASLPLQATLAFRTIENGVPRREISAEPTLPAPSSLYPANAFLGIAMANPNRFSAVTVNVSVRNLEGAVVGQVQILVPANGHRSFTLLQLLPGIGPSFEGTVQLNTATLQPDFIAWALASDSAGVVSSLPPGQVAWPISHWDRVWLAFLTTLNAARPFIGPAPVTLDINPALQVNAFASGGNLVQINLALSELISDSPSELAFAVGHELGHIYQQRTGRLEFNINPEKDADVWGFVLSLLAGYDPYAAAGTLSKLAMATGRAGLTSQFENLLSGEAHGSFNERVSTVYDAIEVLCSPSVAKQQCDQIKGVLHPHFPTSVPLLQKEPERVRNMPAQ